MKLNRTYGVWVNLTGDLAEFVPAGERCSATVHADMLSRAPDEPSPADHIAAHVPGVKTPEWFTADVPPTELRRAIERKAQTLYNAATANDPVIHCNRFPAWSELTEESRRDWRTKAAAALNNTDGVREVAPELLEALQEALEFIEGYEDVMDAGDGRQCANRAMRLAQHLRAAIAKATGESA